MPKSNQQKRRALDAEFLEALRTAPVPAQCPWMRVEVQGESGRWMVFSMAVWSGWIVATAPIAKPWFGQRARDAWRFWRGRGAKLCRIDDQGVTGGRS
jgi:hypothetical protein